jgi:hypothetical protein
MASSETCPCDQDHENQQTATSQSEKNNNFCPYSFGKIESRPQQYQILKDQPPGNKGKHKLERFHD